MRQVRRTTAAAIASFSALALFATPSIAAGDHGTQSAVGRVQPGADNSAKSALVIRYARGEINRGEYLERKRNLA